MLLKFFRWLIGGCDHRWEIFDEATVTTRDEDGIERERFTRYFLRCTKCGNLKTKNMN